MLTTRKLSAISFGVTALAGAALLAAGCINSFRADGDSKPAPAPGAGIQAAGCPDLCTPGPLEVVGSSASVAQFRPTVNRLRIEVVGDIVSSGASLQSLGACATAPAPAGINFSGGPNRQLIFEGDPGA